MPTAQQNQMRDLLNGIDRQLAESEEQLLKAQSPQDISKIVERIANLKVARQNLVIVLETDRAEK